MNNPVIAVVGGSGFIGTRLIARLLATGYGVRIIDLRHSTAHPSVPQIIADVRDLPTLTRALNGADIVYNLAAEHRDDVSPIRLYDEVNVQGARNVCDAAAATGARQLIFTSSVAVYGPCDGEADEATTPGPDNDYGRTKREAEEVYRQWLRENGNRSLVLVRPTVVFGEGNRGNVYNLMQHIAGRRFVMIGDGRNRKSIAYVENVAAFLEYVLRLGSGEHLYNYVDKPDYSMNTLVETIRRRLGLRPTVRVRLPYHVGYALGMLCDAAAFISRKKLSISAVRVKKFVSETCYSSHKLENSGFRRPVSLEEALKRTVAAEFGEGGTRIADVAENLVPEKASPVAIDAAAAKNGRRRSC